ncbi:MAG: M14 family metallopeptidase [Candidatus Aminicenantes bacterium]|nr:M14 family metallopeptidase [Candidatus Aminicenantes bacterium]
MKRSIFILFIFISVLVFKPLHLPAATGAGLTLTTAESSNYTGTTLYEDVIDFLFYMQEKADIIKILNLTTSTEGRKIPLVVLSAEGIKSAAELRLVQEPVVLINANIHAGEIEGKEAALMLIREFAQHKLDHLLQNQVILILPIFNPDGNEKLGKNRRDNGPELAGIRANGQNLDLNRDFLKLESPEVKALVKLFNEWDPVLFVDLHTTNGSYHREPVTYMTLNNPNTSGVLQDYMWQKFFPAAAKILAEKYGYDSLPYGNFVDRAEPGKGWRNHAFEARYGTNYAGLRNMFTILDENYSHADFKTRVLACLGFVKSILHYTKDHIKEMRQIQREVNLKTKRNYHRDKFALEHKTEKLKQVTIKSYVFKKEKIKPEDRKKFPPWYGEYYVTPTKTHRDYTVPYFTKAVPTRSIELPMAYIISPHQPKIVKKLKNHGIVVEKVRKEVKAGVEKFVIENLQLAKRVYQGHVFVTIKGHYVEEEVVILKGSYYVSMRQPLARVIATLLEPECTDSLAAWGYFNRQIVRQWSSRFGFYPVFRLHKAIPIELYQE